jgi:hypothetical protein
MTERPNKRLLLITRAASLRSAARLAAEPQPLDWGIRNSISMQTGKRSQSVRIAPVEGVPRRTGGATRAWVAVGRVDADGRRARSASRTATVIFAVNVNSSVPATTTARVDLMDQVARILGGRVEPGVSSLWVFPGGYFGFDAGRGTRGDWLDLRESDVHQIQREVRRVFQGFPRKSVLTFGVDYLDRQQAWVMNGASTDAMIHRITRKFTPLSQRIFAVGEHRAAAFVCGEFTGSRTSQNGPFFVDAAGRTHYLEEPERQLSECQILIDLAHQRVSGGVHAPPNRRMVQQRQMERFSRHGVAVLAHHHAGEQNDGRAHFKHQSSWIVFPEADWLSNAEVVNIP